MRWGVFLLGLWLFSCSSGKEEPLCPCRQYGKPVEVTLQGYDGDVMEPFLSRDGKYLFFNSLNDGVTTSLYYALRLDDTLFRFAGEVKGVNHEPPHLEAVPSMDREGNFYYITTHDYPDQLKNLMCGHFSGGEVTGVHPVEGDFYTLQVGWLIMGAEIGAEGEYLFYTKARFREGPVPEEAFLGIARRKDTLFLQEKDAGQVLATLNDPSYLVYGVAVADDKKEIFFTRLKKGGTATEICMAVRSSLAEPFGEPCVLVSGDMAEAPALGPDGVTLYFHRKDPGDGKYHLFLMRRH